MTKTREPRSTEPTGPWALGLTMLRSPTAAAQACRDPRSWRAVLLVYAAFELGHLLFFWLKPADFPDTGARMARESFLFWLGARLSNVPLQAATIAMALAAVRWMAEGKMFFKLVTALAVCLYAAFPLLYIKAPWMTTPVFIALGLVWMAPVPFLARAWPRETAWHAVRFMLALNALGIFVILPMAAATAVRSQMGFMLAQGLVGFWLIGAGAVGMREVCGVRLPRAFMAMLFVMAFQSLLVGFLYFSGIMPKAILKAVIYG